jgi:hypothetical protein
MRRCDDPTTYMEVYEGVPDERRVRSAARARSLEIGSTRRIERFVCA